ncbi:4'-phosphopantetheinyl transferase superfamily protein [Methylocapsa polymorpha]|uniref:4'-phosphopantetheinyl transferase superfamily protein n=1 Tax=Methylocapsa polymorpha TaxID=3080828 RepID=A0ABZ0HQH7_9HYPH|nr:4'-phosphopantetheinyl transferase superfamily protein [Methylocapsa sp. RX1]
MPMRESSARDLTNQEPPAARFDLRRLEAKGAAPSLWLLGLADPIGRALEHANDLSAEERSRADRFFRAEDRTRFVLTRAALRSLLGEATGCPPKDIAFETGAYGKPHLAHGRGPHFNVSHSGSFALIGISDRPIGVDIELMRDTFDELALARAFFCEDEHHFLAGLERPAQLQSFYKIWTCKEAVLKAFGVGISNYLMDFSIELTPDGFRIRPKLECFTPRLTAVLAEPVEAPPGYAAAVALA